MIRRWLITLAVFCALAPAPAPAEALPDEDAVVARPGLGAVIETDPRAMAGLELRGLSLARLFGAPPRRAHTNDVLARTPLFARIIAVLGADLDELGARPGIGGLSAPNHAFSIGWLRDPRARFELAGVVNRLDRRFVPGEPCGETRLVYRLVLEPSGRPTTALPMTLNLGFVQRGDCRAIAAAWERAPLAGSPRVEALAALVARLGPFERVETNLQNLHGPALRPGEDDHAEYLLHTFERRGDDLALAPLLDTPREALSGAEKDALAAWIRGHFAEIDSGSFAIPSELAATRAVSVAPRGMTRARNRVFARLFGDGAAFWDLPYASAKAVKSPRGLLRRLDQATCSGCHESRAIAGFHLLGDERDPDARFNALAVARSAHLEGELPWRARALDAAARGATYDAPRPFADRGADDGGGGAGGSGGAVGARCALGDDPTFAAWTCAAGLRCRDVSHDPFDALGSCAPADGDHEGDACEDARATPARTADAPDGDRVAASPKEGCVFEGTPASEDACSPNHYGFPGGMCSAECATLGPSDGGSVCADIPAAGYESDCFPARAPIEACLVDHSARRRVRACDATAPCRDDYACARVPGLPPDRGACVPPYFVFQARVDGPVLDR